MANCTFRSCHGLALEEVDGGILENITVNNLSMMNVRDYAIYLTTGKRNRAPDVATNSRARNILISNVIADGVDKMSGIQIMGLPEQPIEGVRLENIRLTSKGGGTAKDAARHPKELGAGYPEPGGIGMLPAYGIFARHVRDLELANIHMDFRTMICVPPRRLPTFRVWRLITSNRSLRGRESRCFRRQCGRHQPFATRPHWENNQRRANN